MGIDRAALRKIAQSKASGGGNYVRDGEYLFLIRKMFGIKAYKGNTIILELTVVESKPSGELDANGQPIAPNPPGSHASLVWKIDEHPDVAPKNVKGAVLGILGYTEDQMTEDQYEALLDKVLDEKVNPLRGMYVRASTYVRFSKKGNRLVLPNWEKVTQTKEEVKARRAQLDGSDATAQAMPAPAPAPVAAPAPAPAPVTPAVSFEQYQAAMRAQQAPAPAAPAPAAAPVGLPDLPF
jgi:hypothetical protein